VPWQYATAGIKGLLAELMASRGSITISVKPELSPVHGRVIVAVRCSSEKLRLIGGVPLTIDDFDVPL
jgi:hypothetical protein